MTASRAGPLPRYPRSPMGRLLRALLCLAVATGLGCGRGPAPEKRPLSISVFYDLDTLEPGRRDRVSDFAVLSNIYEPLVTTDARLAVRPALAARGWRGAAPRPPMAARDVRDANRP